MTPNNILNMAQLKELDVIALTDHNSCKNCPGLFEAAEGTDLIVIAGAEVCTCEEIHAVCLFETLEGAMAFDAALEKHLPPIENQPDAFGHQTILNGEDQPVGEFSTLLITGCDLSISELPGFAAEFGGHVFCAHIDKNSYSVISVLSEYPELPGVTAAEIANPAKIDQLLEKYPALKECQILTDSDAHYLWDMSERYYSIPCEERSREAFFRACFGK
ncbi:MAG: PHP domain-containing protein [Oscillospiraceae bacterium]|nr:PHP domain-containing protein [Oscillospiraceae bacterium]